ncbi:uncharacterized protein [Ptychodera flava]|uniref:uncharacterized protein n=1 Tax=Ptychodera flava TaxID=63121 RepID=UPI00396A3C34
MTKMIGDVKTRMPDSTIGGPCLSFPDQPYECPEKLPFRDDGQHMFSTCPWKYINNYDPAREPMLIKNVTCLCETCRSIEVSEDGDFIEEDTMQSTCAAIHYDMPVLRWSDYTRSGPGTPGTERINVACTCLGTDYRT